MSVENDGLNPLPGGEMPRRAENPANREPVSDSAAASAAGLRLAVVGGSIFRAFDGLDCGIGHDEAVEFLRAAMPDARTIGAAMAFAMVAVESDRDRRRHG